MKLTNKALALTALVLWFAAFQASPAVPVAAADGMFPATIQLTGVSPEGIASGNGTIFYAGSLSDGHIVRGDFRTGVVENLVGPQGHPTVGLKFDPRTGLLFAAGGSSGTGKVYDAATGDLLMTYNFVVPPTGSFINDVVITREAAYFTNSNTPALYRVALGPGGEPLAGFETVVLPANFGASGGCGGATRANGIVATPDGAFLIVVHTSEGQIYRVDTATHSVTQITVSGGDLAGGFPLCNGDGLLLSGHTLYVVQNFLNRVAVVELAPDLLSGTITGYITEPFASNAALRVPTTIAEFGNHLYAVTAGFAPPTPDFVVRLDK